ncbi:MAG: zinc ABC transporter substrate-binding protein [Thermosynechococcaceae cyanobacterium]
MHKWLLATLSGLVLGLGSCGNNPSQTTVATDPAPKLKVVTTFLPITQFTQAVAGDRTQVMQLLPTAIGPHDYQAKPQDAQKLANANVLVENGLEMEHFLDDLVKNAANPNLKTIDSSQGIAVIANDLGETHATEPKGQAEEHEHGTENPHIWLDPKRAIQQVENIRDGLIAADPDGKETYRANAANYIAKLKDLDAAFVKALKPFAGKTFVTYHDFAPYFAQSYKLKAEFLVGIPEENASPEDVQRVIQAAQQSNLKTLLTEPQAVGNPFTALAQDLNVQISEFDPLETAGTGGGEPDYYLRVMRQNVENLKSAFSGPRKTSFLRIPAQFNRMAFTAQPVKLGF